MAYEIDPKTGMPTCFAGEAGGYCCYDCYGCGFNYESALCEAEAARQEKEANAKENDK